MTDHAAVLHLDGTLRFIPWPESANAQLDVLRAEIDCAYVEVVNLAGILAELPDVPGMFMWIDEDGKGGLDTANPLATGLARELYRAIDLHDFIAGRVVFTGGADEQGHTLPLDEEARTFLLKVSLTYRAHTGKGATS